MMAEAENAISGGGGSDGPTHVMVTRLLNLHEIVSDEG